MAKNEKKINEKNIWDKWDIILKPVGGLITGIAIALLGFLGSNYLNHRQNIDTRLRLYTELISQREQSESLLRKDMFKSIIDTFLNPGTTRPPGPREKMLNLELLASNFHESLNLQPLFLELEREIINDKGQNQQKYLDRMERLAKDIVAKQSGVLAAAGDSADRSINLANLNEKTIYFEDADLSVGGIKRNFNVSVLGANRTRREIRVRLEISTPAKNGELEKTEREFDLGFFDFPMINNTRLSNDQRCAVVLNGYEGDLAEISILYFPGSHASLREKPFYEELIKNLLESGQGEKKTS